jgi:hypothetical protein
MFLTRHSYVIFVQAVIDRLGKNVAERLSFLDDRRDISQLFYLDISICFIVTFNRTIGPNRIPIENVTGKPCPTAKIADLRPSSRNVVVCESVEFRINIAGIWFSNRPTFMLAQNSHNSIVEDPNLSGCLAVLTGKPLQGRH